MENCLIISKGRVHCIRLGKLTWVQKAGEGVLPLNRVQTFFEVN